jgi:hypothetical protein
LKDYQMDDHNHSLYEDAPDLILNKLAEINDILAKLKVKNGETESYKFWSNVAEIMLYAWQYTQDLHFIIERNRLLGQENSFLRSYTAELEKRLLPYEMTRKLILSGKLQEYTDKINKLILEGNKETRHPDNTPKNA